MAQDREIKLILEAAMSKGLNRRLFMSKLQRQEFVQFVRTIQADKTPADKWSVYQKVKR